MKYFHKIALFIAAASVFIMVAGCSSSGAGDDSDSSTPTPIPTPTIFTVTFDSQGADTVSNPTTLTVTYPAKTVGTLPTAPEKASMLFAGWYTQPAGGGSEFTATTTVTANITVYAKWIALYTVTFDSQDATTAATPGSLTTNSAGNITALPTAPVKTGYNFGGWYTGINGTGTAFTVNTQVTSNLIVYASWLKLYSVSFDANGGTGSMDSLSGVSSASIILPANTFTNPGYLFDGWSISGSDTCAYPDASSIVLGSTDIVLKARWVENPAGLTYYVTSNKVTIDGNGTGATTINIPESICGYPVTAIRSYAFSNCKSLTAITIPTSVTSIGTYAFYYCDSLGSVTIPNSVTAIDDNAFFGCKNLTTVQLSNSVTAISDSTFRGCSSLTSITIPYSVTSIGPSAFANCAKLSSVNLNYAGKLSSIGSAAFLDCSGLSSINIPPSVISIEGYAFNNCTGLTNIDIPSSVTSIGDSAFEGCSGLTSATIYAPTVVIGNHIFDWCPNLSSFTSYISTPPKLSSLYLGSSITVIKVPAALVPKYKTAWNSYASIIVSL